MFAQIEVIKALALLKKAAAEVNVEFGLDATVAENIKRAADEVCGYREKLVSSTLPVDCSFIHRDCTCKYQNDLSRYASVVTDLLWQS